MRGVAAVGVDTAALTASALAVGVGSAVAGSVTAALVARGLPVFCRRFSARSGAYLRRWAGHLLVAASLRARRGTGAGDVLPGRRTDVGEDTRRPLMEASASTIWRWLHDDELKPWQQRSWIFVRDSRFAEKAGPVLDLYLRGTPVATRRVRDLTPTRRRSCKRSAAATRRCRPLRGRPPASSSSTNATARSPTSQAGTSTTPTCSIASHRRTGSTRSAASLNR